MPLPIVCNLFLLQAIRQARRLSDEMQMSSPSPKQCFAFLRALARPLMPPAVPQRRYGVDMSKSAKSLPSVCGDKLLKELAENANGLSKAHLTGIYQRIAIATLERTRGDEPREISSIPESLLPTANEWWKALWVARADMLANLSLQDPVLRSQLGASAVDANVALGALPTGDELFTSILLSFQEPSFFEVLGVNPPRGVLLHGPPGCGKTSLARAVALAVKANFVEAQAPYLLSSLVGESEKRLAALFDSALAAAPCILFVDQLEALAPPRGHDSSSEQTLDRLLSLLLVYLDGIHRVSGPPLIFLGTTGAPNQLDSAILRPGRLDMHLLVKVPGEAQRLKLLEQVLHGMMMDDIALPLKRLTLETRGFSLAQLSAVCREAAMCALREDPSLGRVDMHHFEEARARLGIPPSDRT